MAPRRTHSTLARVAVLSGAAVALHRFGSNRPAYAVRGSWEGAPTSLKNFAKGDFDEIFKGLEPNVDLPALAYDREGLALSLEDGRLNVDYGSKFGQDSTLNLRVNDERNWRASFRNGDASLSVHGEGFNMDDLSWEASQRSSVDGVGDVDLAFNSDKNYNLTVARQNLANIVGADLSARVRACNEGVTGCLQVQRQLPGNVDLSYSVENPVGVYDVAQSTHNAVLSVPVGGGDASIKLTSEDSNQGYHASYSRDVSGGKMNVRVSREGEELGYSASYDRSLSDVLKGQGVDADMQIGADNDGVYGKLSASRDLSDSMKAQYEAAVKVGLANERTQQVAQALKVSNGLGYAQLVHEMGESPKLKVGYEFDA